MKTSIKKLFTLPLLIAILGLIHTGSASAQTFKTLYNFQASASGSAPNPAADLTLSGRTLYGTGSFGGTNGYGLVFGFNLDNSTFTNIYSFTTPSYNGYNALNSDGMWPYSNLILLGNSLYGLTEQGGTGDAGTVFKVNTDGTGFADLNNFINFPAAETSVLLGATLIITNNTLFGTATFGGTYSDGTLFAGGTNGASFNNFYTFTGGADGKYPMAGLVSGTNFYGAAYQGGGSGNGTIFKVGTNGIGFTVLHSFTAAPSPAHTNSDGARPGSLLLSGNTLYGQTAFGGSSANGTVFKLNTDGSGFTNLHSFSTTSGSGTLDGTNSDGAGAAFGFVLSGNTLYGAAFGGGQFGHGTIFSLNTNGTGFTVLYAFTAGVGSYFNVTNNDGAYPIGGLILSSNILYGTTSAGGTSSFGTIFRISLPAPNLAVLRSGTNFILTWPTNFTGYKLLSTTNLASPTAWVTNITVPVVVNTNNVVTNIITGTQMFYRLSQ